MNIAEALKKHQLEQPLKIYCMGLQDRSDRVRWLLEELEVPYEDNFLKRKKGELKTAEYQKLNPMSRVPTLICENQVIFESVGIALYIADRFKAVKSMAPDLNHPDRGAYLQWMVWSVGSLECVVAKMFTLNGKTESQRNEILEFVKEQCEILKKPLVQTLEKQEFILKSGYSAADIMLACIIPGAWDYLVKDTPVLERYMQKMMNMPLAIKGKVFEIPDMSEH